MDDFALCIHAKSLLHAQRLAQLCVNSVQDSVSNNGCKFSTNKTVCMYFCNQCKHFAKPSILLDKNPIKVVMEAKFLGVIFDWTLSYNSHVNYLKTNCLKALDILKVVGHAVWGGRSENSTLPLSNPCKIWIKIWLYCIWDSFKQHSKENGPCPSPRLTNCSWSFSYFSCNKPLCESTRDVFEKQTQETVYELCFKTKNLSW